jgi:hypothetical protein
MWSASVGMCKENSLDGWDVQGSRDYNIGVRKSAKAREILKVGYITYSAQHDVAMPRRAQGSPNFVQEDLWRRLFLDL